MRFVQFRNAGEKRVGAVVDDRVLDLAAVLSELLVRDGYSPDTAVRIASARIPTEISDFFALGSSSVGEAQRLIDAADKESDRSQWSTSADDVEFEPPLSPANVVYCTGYNYADHAAEASAPPRPVPGLFMRTRDSLVGHRQDVLRPAAVSTDFDFEVELGVVIGKPCHRVSKEAALDHVAGYTIFNDGSVRDYQKQTELPTAGKNFFRSGSLGPWIVTLDEFAEPEALELETRVNGETMQAANTRDMIFDVRATISYFSEFAVLQPGDVIGTGTPAGIGFRRNPPVYLVPDDQLEFEIEGIGILENRVVDEVPEPVVARV